MTMTPEQQLATFVAGFDGGRLPADALERARQILTAVVGTTIAGAHEDGCDALATHLFDEGGRGQATVLVRGGRLPAAKTALLNGTMARALDYCDAIQPGLHAGSSVVPAAFAAAELSGACTGADFIAAVAIGAEVATRMNLSEAMYDGFDPTGVACVFGSTAAACRLLNLTAEQTLHALALAFNRAGGSFQSNVDGSLAVRLIQGWVAETGVTCALLARAGLTGPRRFIHGVYGYCHLFGRGELDPASLAEGLGMRWAMVRTCFKRYPSCGLTQAVTDLAKQSLEELACPPERVSAIDIHLPLYAHRLVGRPFVAGDNPRVSAQFSAQYCVANVWLRGDSKLEHFTTEAVCAPEIERFVGRIGTQVDESLHGRGHTAVDLEVATVDGRRQRWSLDLPKGTPATPLTEAEHLARLDDCLNYAGFEQRGPARDRLLDCLHQPERMKDVRDLIASMHMEA